MYCLSLLPPNDWVSVRLDATKILFFSDNTTIAMKKSQAIAKELTKILIIRE